jgi:hypothetical protein
MLNQTAKSTSWGSQTAFSFVRWTSIMIIQVASNYGFMVRRSISQISICYGSVMHLPLKEEQVERE